MTRRDSEDSLQNDEKTKYLLMNSRPSNDIMPDFHTKTDVTLSDVNKHQTPWMPGALKTSAADHKKSKEEGVVPRGGDASMTLATPQPPSATNPSGPRTNYNNISGSTILTGANNNSSQKKKPKTVRFPTTIDDGGTMGAGRRRGRYSPPPSPPRTTSAISGDTADMRDTLSMREGEGEATDVSELDLEGSVDEKPIHPAESDGGGGVVGEGEEGGGKSDDNNSTPLTLKAEKKKRKSPPMKNTTTTTSPRRESPRNKKRQRHHQK